jgi:hypothetical protein
MNAMPYREFETRRNANAALPPTPKTSGKSREVLLELYRATSLTREDLIKIMIERATETDGKIFGRYSRWWIRMVWNPVRINLALTKLNKLGLVRETDTISITPLGMRAAL